MTDPAATSAENCWRLGSATVKSARAVRASASGWPMTSGTGSICGPSETNIVISEPRRACSPAAGSVPETWPGGTTGSFRSASTTTKPSVSSTCLALSGSRVAVSGTVASAPGPAPKYQPVPAARPVSSSTSAKIQ